MEGIESFAEISVFSFWAEASTGSNKAIIKNNLFMSVLSYSGAKVTKINDKRQSALFRKDFSEDLKQKRNRGKCDQKRPYIDPP